MEENDIEYVDTKVLTYFNGGMPGPMYIGEEGIVHVAPSRIPNLLPDDPMTLTPSELAVQWPQISLVGINTGYDKWNNVHWCRPVDVLLKCYPLLAKKPVGKWKLFMPLLEPQTFPITLAWNHDARKHITCMLLSRPQIKRFKTKYEMNKEYKHIACMLLDGTLLPSRCECIQRRGTKVWIF